MNTTGVLLKIELHGEEAEDGRILVRSPDLEGFYFVVPSGEDPVSTMKPTLMEFVQVYLKAEVRRIESVQTPRQFRHSALGIMPSPSRDFSVFAEVAA